MSDHLTPAPAPEPMTPALRIAPGSIVERFAPTGVFVRTSAGRSVYVDHATPTGALDVYAAILTTLQTIENRTEPSGQWSPYDLALTTGYGLDDVRAALELLDEYGHVHARYVGGVSKYLYDADDDAPKCAGVYAVTLDELESMPTLGVGQTDDRKMDDGQTRVWLARTTPEDGEPWPHRVDVERYDGSSWHVVESWQAVAAAEMNR